MYEARQNKEKIYRQIEKNVRHGIKQKFLLKKTDAKRLYETNELTGRKRNVFQTMKIVAPNGGLREDFDFSLLIEDDVVECFRKKFKNNSGKQVPINELNELAKKITYEKLLGYIYKKTSVFQCDNGFKLLVEHEIDKNKIQQMLENIPMILPEGIIEDTENHKYELSHTTIDDIVKNFFSNLGINIIADKFIGHQAGHVNNSTGKRLCVEISNKFYIIGRCIHVGQNNKMYQIIETPIQAFLNMTFEIS